MVNFHLLSQKAKENDTVNNSFLPKRNERGRERESTKTKCSNQTSSTNTFQSLQPPQFRPSRSEFSHILAMSSASIDLSSLLSGADRRRRTPLGGVARFLRRTRMAREPSTLIRESETDQLEDRQSGWAYSKPVVALDTLWNLAFVVVAGFLLYLSREEKPVVPLRLWVVGYAVQCIMHVVCVLAEYRRRVREGEGEEREDRRHADADYSLVPDLEMNRVYGNQQSQEITRYYPMLFLILD